MYPGLGALYQPFIYRWYTPGVPQYSLYVHIPFCSRRCSYCDFNTYAGLEELIPEYVQAVCREVEFLTASVDISLPVHTVFIGGGTPSLLPLGELERIFRVLEDGFDFVPNLEVTLEANPGSLSLAYLDGLHSLGVNRLSVGMQSAHPGELRLLERRHRFEDVVQAVAWARAAGFNNLNLDLIFGLPGQSLDAWMWTLEMALNLEPEHFSLYALTLERGTPMQYWVGRGLIEEPDEDLGAEMYERAAERLAAQGYIQYEISNWAREQGSGEVLVCRHNMQYWRNQAYLGLGAGAHGYASNMRVANVLSPYEYIQCIGDRFSKSDPWFFPQTPATADVLEIDRATEMAETMMMGLRLTREGIAATTFQERFGDSLEQVYGRQIARLEASGLLAWIDEGGVRLHLTPRGRLLGNQVFKEFV